MLVCEVNFLPKICSLSKSFVWKIKVHTTQHIHGHVCTRVICTLSQSLSGAIKIMYVVWITVA